MTLGLNLIKELDISPIEPVTLDSYDYAFTFVSPRGEEIKLQLDPNGIGSTKLNRIIRFTILITKKKERIYNDSEVVIEE